MAENINKNANIEEEDNFLVDLFDDDGNKQTFEHLDTVQVNGADYVICIPYKEEEDDEVDEVIILRIDGEQDGESVLVPEDDLEILDKAYEIFKERNAELFDFED